MVTVFVTFGKVLWSKGDNLSKFFLIVKIKYDIYGPAV